ncbi:hypothetical protein IW140_000180 [Coemansia sp. RSA 1813]|nr:hypothetical protein EV178_000014 [Coemansia sp. RSA 1646]KAJ1772346.1 hypothetical protein LPJ74_001611 [Coemansia sp. RSA 1843]KAJ2093284.1 hypothetical protein IW138_000577 [Coemansia sp. RSA 986]KAJ2213027.1 hypothetical protein EV179_004175 [Coemansia sp. RSA 487]KAJ2573538.1 hypothetical protein IW140_000180 [Coemansia sp. RSA 1813]
MFTHLRTQLVGQGKQGIIKHLLQQRTTMSATNSVEANKSNSKPSLVVDYDYETGTVTEQKTKMSARDFMLSSETGIYTAMRTVCGGKRVFLFDDHLQRLGNSHRVVLPKDMARRDDPEYWRRILCPLIRRGVDAFSAECPDDEAKITVLAGTREARLHFTCLNTHKQVACWVRFVTGVRRDTPEAKNIQWVHERESLEPMIAPPVNEVVLTDRCSEGERFYEGISSNFFATRRISSSSATRAPEYLNYQLVSAPRDCVLLGTVMKLVLRICDRDGIQVVYDPSVDFGGWNGAFVSSTSRWVLPIETIVYGHGDAVAEHRLDASDPLVAHLRESVKNMAAENSTKM